MFVAKTAAGWWLCLIPCRRLWTVGSTWPRVTLSSPLICISMLQLIFCQHCNTYSMGLLTAKQHLSLLVVYREFYLKVHGQTERWMYVDVYKMWKCTAEPALVAPNSRNNLNPGAAALPWGTEMHLCLLLPEEILLVLFIFCVIYIKITYMLCIRCTRKGSRTVFIHVLFRCRL